MIPTLTINMDKKCAECGKMGASGSGICISCVAKAMEGKPMKSKVGKAVQDRIRQRIKSNYVDPPIPKVREVPK